MNKLMALMFGMLLIGCDTTHKLTGTDYVDIEMESAPDVVPGYPQAIIEEAGWNDITTELKSKDEEEFRIWLNSPVYPGNLYKLTKDKKRNVEGEGILYWPVDNTRSNEGFTHQKMKRYLEGICTEFFQIEEYGYCYPEFIDDISWGSIYNVIESQGFWQIPNGTEIVAPEKEWQMYVQMRLRNYYRDYTHHSPQEYEDAELRKNVIALAKAVKLITNRFKSNTNTNTFEGVTDGTAFTLCDSSETWKLNGDLNKLLAKSGIKSTINTEEKESLYYVMVKGRVTNIWYDEWATGEFDRKLSPTDIYKIQVVHEIACPEEISGY
ncbi:MAG: hypothetical protein WD022_11985 [Balneolaceae bacterium]